MKNQTVKVNGKKYEIIYKEWFAWNGKKCRGYSCQVDKDNRLGASTLSKLIDDIKNHKPINQDGAESWYGQGRYMGD